MIAVLLRITCFVLAMAGIARADETMRLAVTTSFHNSGLADVLLPKIHQDTGISVQLLVVGTGQALRLGRAGDVDAVLVHSRAAEEAFIAKGYGTHRREIMFNDFVLIGPRNDPAQITNARNITEALTRIAEKKALFVSRGDDSGTHRRELALWQSHPTEPWYRAVGAGMGAALNTASGLDAYILSDRASWLNFANKGNLALLYAGDKALHNQYAYLPTNPAKHPHLRHDLATHLENWLTSPTAKTLINNHQINGQQLFMFNASN